MSLVRDAFERRFKGRVHLVHGNKLYASSGRKIFVSDDAGDSWRLLLELPLGLSARLRSSSRLRRRLFRSAVHHIACVEDRRLVIMGFGKIFAYDLHELRAPPLTCSIQGRRPLTLCNTGAALFYGEYASNTKRRAMHVYGSYDRGESWQAVHRFDSVRHVHGVHWDLFGQKIWITTGDEDSECGLWETADQFESVALVLGGGQQQRAVQPLFTRKYVYFGTDAPDEQNFLYRFCRETNTVEQMAAVEGPVFYGCSVGSRLFFATVCEPSRVNTHDHAVVWGSDDTGERWAPILRFKKDRWPMKLLQYGQVLFPAGANNEPFLWVTPQGTEYDQLSLRYRLT